MNDRKPTFFTSDWHIGHENVIRFDNRPFVDLGHMHKVLINNYNNTVPKNGVCYFLGDFGLTQTNVIREVMDQLNGTKVAILGNHDKGMNAYYNCGFDVVLNGAKLYIANHEVTLSHCPLLGLFREDTTGMKNTNPGENWHGEYRHSRFSFPNFNQFHLHGHTHKRPKERTLLKQYDVGVVANNYTPVNISLIESWIATYEKGNNGL